MFVIVATILIAAVAADRLENTYLPPGSARTAGGNGNFLAAPFGSSGRPSSQYGTPGNHQGGSAGFRQRPGNEYGAPAAGGGQGGGYSSQGAAGGYNAGGFGGAQSRDGGAAILRYNNENFGDGSYRFEFETENQISQQESGELKDADTSSVTGTYSYVGDDGRTYTVNYIADENGFRPQGEHIHPSISEGAEKAAQNAGYDDGYQQGGAGGYQQGGAGGYQQGGAGGYQQGGAGGYQQGGGAAGGYQQGGAAARGYQQSGGAAGGYSGSAGGYTGASRGGHQQGGFNQGGASARGSFGGNQATNRQYLAPNRQQQGFNQQSGYQY